MELTRTFPNLEWVEYQKLELKFWAAQMLLLSYSHRLRWHGFSLPDFLSDVSETWHFALACFLSCEDYSQLPPLSLPLIFFNLSLACFIYFKSLYRKNFKKISRLMVSHWICHLLLLCVTWQTLIWIWCIMTWHMTPVIQHCTSLEETIKHKTGVSPSY